METGVLVDGALGWKGGGTKDGNDDGDCVRLQLTGYIYVFIYVSNSRSFAFVLDSERRQDRRETHITYVERYSLT